MTMAMPLPIWAPMPSPTIICIMARTVVKVVIRIGRILVLPVAIRALLRSTPPMRSWFV